MARNSSGGITSFSGYRESADLSMIPNDALAYPSRNVLLTKGKVITRGGLENDGVTSTVDEGIHSEFVWKDAPGGQRPLRVYGHSLQVKHLGKWVTIFDGLDADTTRVFFTTWIDSNTAVFKKRLFFCDGTGSIYQWNGLIATVESWASPIATVVADRVNLGLMGADADVGQAFTLFSLDSNGNVDGTESLTYSADPTLGLTITCTTPPSTIVPVAGDLIISTPITYANAVLTTFKVDVLYTYNSHVIAANYNSVQVFFSSSETFTIASGLNFVQPAANDRTATSPILLQLDGNFTAMMARKNVLWVSDHDDWYKVTKSAEQNAYYMWVDVEKFETGESKGCLPMALAKHKGDIIYFAQDFSLQRITTIDVLGKDDIQLLSDGVESLFKRMNPDGVRLYYLERGIFMVFPNEGTLIILDTAEQTWFFQPPQDIPMSCISVINGVMYGHHNARNETFRIFKGRMDLQAERAQSVIALGYMNNGNNSAYKRHGIFGLNCRLTDSTEVTADRYFEENGSKATSTCSFKGDDIKTFKSNDDVSIATNPYGSRSWAGADMIVEDLNRAFVFDTESCDGYFEFRPIITIGGKQSEFHLLAIYFDEDISNRKVGDDLFIPRT